MAGILVKPPELRQKASELRQRANALHQSIEAIDAETRALSNAVFEGYSADRYRTRYGRLRDRIFSFKPFLDTFAQALENAAEVFSHADGQGQGQD